MDFNYESSDEESNETNANASLISESDTLIRNLNDFKEKNLKSFIKHLDKVYEKIKKNYAECQFNEDLPLSFITHTLGISILYSPKINKRYYELKKKHLSSDASSIENNIAQLNGNLGNNCYLKLTTDQSLFNLNHLSKDKYLVEFLACLRLRNKSNKRQIINFETKEETTISNTLNICDMNIDIETTFYYNSKKIAENIKIKNERLTYTQYSNELSKKENKNLFEILKEHRINIANDTILFKNADQKNFFVSFWYNIFGLETIRNPAHLIHINMFLDIAEKIEWPRNGYPRQTIYKYLPMASEYAVMKSRWLNSYFNKFMPHQHSYDLCNDIRDRFYTDKESESIILIEREAFLVKKWLEWKIQNTEGLTVPTIHSLIKESFSEWGLILKAKKRDFTRRICLNAKKTRQNITFKASKRRRLNADKKH